MRPVVLAVALAIAFSGAQAAEAQTGPVVSDAPLALQRGAYIFNAAGCQSCHTDKKAKGPLLGGGGPLVTPFGTFYGPNISPSQEYGIGSWSDEDFRRALREGVGPEGQHYYPSFPYTSFAAMGDRDIDNLKSYIFSLPAIEQPSRPHELKFPFGFRIANLFWKWLFFDGAPFAPDPAASDQVNRGAYIVRALTHCGECHTPRNLFGAIDMDMWLAGTADGPEGDAVPNITPDPATGIGNWDSGEIETYLSQGMTPDGDFAGSLMADVIEHSTGRLSAEDVQAIAAYLKSIPLVVNDLGR